MKVVLMNEVILAKLKAKGDNYKDELEDSNLSSLLDDVQLQVDLESR